MQRSGSSIARRTMLTPKRSSVADPDAVEGGLAADEGHAAAGDDALFDGRTRRVHRVLDAAPSLLHLDLGRRADA
mgnify:CR=1 FL=1